MHARSLVLTCFVVGLGVTGRTAAGSPIRVAVLTFQSGGGTPGDLGSIGSGLQSMITTDLSQARVLELVERSRLKDIETEVKLARSGLVDPKTAVRIGKLAGATHLVAGSFTIVGKQMRLDARLFAVVDGKVLLGEQISGETDAFFELEKQLVGKLIRSLGVALGPKERADLGRVHTSDFDAFRAYSKGLELFDAKRYEDAFAALRDAERRDTNFKLATLTLAECERVVAALRLKANDIDAAKERIAALAQDEAHQGHAQMVQRLLAIAARSGDPARPQRIAALYKLALWFASTDDLPDTADLFEHARIKATLWQRYFAEAAELFPRFPLWPARDFGELRPASFDQDFKRYVETMARWPRIEPYMLWFDLEKVNPLARMLGLDRQAEVDLRGRLFDLVARLPSSERRDEWRTKQTLELALNLRDIGEYGRSSALFSRLAAAEKSAQTLRQLADEIETNRQLESGTKTRSIAVTHPARGAYGANSDYADYIVIAGSPTWTVRERGTMQTDPQSIPLRANELRFGDAEDQDALVIVDGARRGNLDVAFEISFEPGTGWEPPSRRRRTRDAPAGRHAAVGFAFGVRDVYAKHGPLQATELWLTDSAVQLVERQDPHGTSDPPKLRVLAEQPADFRGQRRLAVTIHVAGTSLTASAGGRSFRFALPAAHVGFYGFAFRAPGYAAVHSWKITGAAP